MVTSGGKIPGEFLNLLKLFSIFKIFCSELLLLSENIYNAHVILSEGPVSLSPRRVMSL